MKNGEGIKIEKKIAIWTTGLAVGLLLVCCIAALLVTKEFITADFGKTAVKAVSAIGVFAVGWCLARTVPRQRLAVAGSVGVLFTVIAMVAKWFLMKENSLCIKEMIAVILLSVGAGILSSREKSKYR